ncbi:MAG: hypothetical protein ABSB76_04765 [Streptosporangiaceae bacterium]|jgi:hypothetical protein
MRFDLLARRIMAPALGVALALTAAACSSSSSTSATGSGSASATTTSAPVGSPVPVGSSTSTGSPGNSASIAAITANWETFFDGKTSAAKKVSLLQNGSTYATAIDALAGSSLATSAGAKVTAVVVKTATSATVSYSITLSGATALPGQTGTAVYQSGVWKVGDVSFCDLLKLENGGTAPAVCSG